MADSPSLESFHVRKRIAEGGFGILDEAVGPNGELVAIKKELASDKVTRPILEHEYHIYKALAGHDCIPDIKAYGRQHKFNVLVMDLLGPSLGDRFRSCGKRFSLRTTAHLALGMFEAIEYIHSRGFIHRDIKPDNFLLGRGTKSQVVHLVDFGLARRWRHSTTGAHMSSSTLEEGSGVIGTLPFASIHAHIGQAQTRRDDLQALAYTILLFARGSLPWDHIQRGTRKHIARRILEKKRSWTAARLCHDLPRELEAFSSYCFGLEVNEEPDYQLLRDRLTAIANREGWNVDAKFEWEEQGWTLSYPPKPAAPLLRQVPPPCIKRGDVVLLKLIPEKSLDYQPPPRSLDLSFFPHQPSPGVEQQPPYRPAVVRKVIFEENDDIYFKLEVYPLTQRSSLNGLSTRRSRNFQRSEALIEAGTGIESPYSDVFLYETTLLSAFDVEYEQAANITSQLSVPECILSRIETELTKVPYSLVYDSDDEETRTIQQQLPRIWPTNDFVMEVRPCEAADLSSRTSADFCGINGWISEIMRLEEVRRLENGECSDSDEDSDEDTEFWDLPRALNRRLSCTIQISG